MIFYLYESTEKTNVEKINDTVEVYSSSFNDLFTKDGIKKVVLNSIKANTCMLSLGTSSYFLDDIYEAIVNNYNYDKIIEMLNKNGVIFFSLCIYIINYGKKIYNLIKDINKCQEIHFNCDSSNLLDTLYLCEKINVPAIIDGVNISLENYQKILDSYDFNRLNGREIAIHYQDYGSTIDINTLYDTSCQINYITKRIKKYNLSPLERVMLVYDIVKNNYYHKEDQRESYLISRTLDNVLNSGYIVCVGYVAIINAMLKNLDINVISMICETKRDRHCRSMIYLKDAKYNIDGIYVLDPTWDSKRHNGHENIDKYNYFLLPLFLAERTAHSGFSSVVNLSLSDFKSLEAECNYGDDNNIEEMIKKTSKIRYCLKQLFELVNNNHYDEFIEGVSFYEFLSEEEIKKLENIYRDVFSKYNINDIDVDTFLRLIYKTKKIEYYMYGDKKLEQYSSRLDLPDTTDISILDIKRSTISRYCKIKVLENVKNDMFDILSYLKYEEKLNEYITSGIGTVISKDIATGIKRDVLNIKLLKLLKNEKVKKEIDNR